MALSAGCKLMLCFFLVVVPLQGLLDCSVLPAAAAHADLPTLEQSHGHQQRRSTSDVPAPSHNVAVQMQARAGSDDRPASAAGSAAAARPALARRILGDGTGGRPKPSCVSNHPPCLPHP